MGRAATSHGKTVNTPQCETYSPSSEVAFCYATNEPQIGVLGCAPHGPALDEDRGTRGARADRDRDRVVYRGRAVGGLRTAPRGSLRVVGQPGDHRRQHAAL